MALTKNGISTTTTRGTFAYAVYYKQQSLTDKYRGLPPEQRVQWDYRDTSGKLHSGIARTLETAYQAAANCSGESVYGRTPE